MDKEYELILKDILDCARADQATDGEVFEIYARHAHGLPMSERHKTMFEKMDAVAQFRKADIARIRNLMYPKPS